MEEFASRRKLLEHVWLVHVGYNISCKICGRKFKRRYHLRRYMAVHKKPISQTNTQTESNREPQSLTSPNPEQPGPNGFGEKRQRLTSPDQDKPGPSGLQW